MDNIRQVLENTQSGGNFYLLLGDFLDKFYKSQDNIKQKMIASPPSGVGLRCKNEILAFTAATAHKLANDYHLEVPPWVFEKNYFLYDQPFFGCNAKGDMRLLFMYKSPSEFKYRNLFVDENVLNRV